MFLSCRSHSLVPLAPYLLKASPVISASSLQHMYKNLEKGVSDIVQNKSCSTDCENSSGSSRSAVVSAKATDVLQQLKCISSVNINLSVLAVTKMPDKLRALYNRKGLQAEVVTAIKDIRAKWKTACKDSHRQSTIEKLKGGNVLTVSKLGEREKLLQRPGEVPSALWRVLARTHNETQLFAIKYVVSSMNFGDEGEVEADNDTRICLIQGPPGERCTVLS